MTKDERDEKIKNLLGQMIDLARKGPITENSDIEFIKKSLTEISNCVKFDLWEQVGKDNYEDVDYQFYDKDDRNNGFAVPNYYFDENNNQYVKNGSPKVRSNLFYARPRLKDANVDIRIFQIMKIVNTIFHEYRHIFQNIQIQQEIPSVYALDQVKQQIVRQKNGVAFYKDNYIAQNGETDARIAADERMQEILSRIKGDVPKQFMKDLYNKTIRTTERDELLKEFEFLQQSKAKGLQDRDYFLDKETEEFVKSNPKILNVLKSLRIEYNLDGSKKTPIQIGNDFLSYILSIKNSNYPNQDEKVKKVKKNYFEILGNSLVHATPEQRKEFLNRFKTTDDRERLCKEMYDYIKNNATESLKSFQQYKNYQSRVLNTSKTQDEIDEVLKIQENVLIQKYNRILNIANNLSIGVYADKNVVVNGLDVEMVEPTALDYNKTKIRNVFITEVLSTYEKLEDKSIFEKRKNFENRYIAQIVNAISTNRCSSGFMKSFEKGSNQSYSEEQLLRLMQVLKTADSLTIEGGSNYLEQFAKVPFINDMLLSIRKDSTFLKLVEQGEKNPQDLLFRTEADQDKLDANEFIIRKSKENLVSAKEIFEKYSRKDSSQGTFIGETFDSKAGSKVWKVSARQQGNMDVTSTELSGYATLGENAIITPKELKKFSVQALTKDCVVNGRNYAAISETLKGGKTSNKEERDD